MSEDFVRRDSEEGESHPEDPYLPAAREELKQLFDQNRERVFFSRQLEVRFEGKFYHWITNRALRDLATGVNPLLRRETAELPHARGIVDLYWHRRNRYPRRAAARVVALVDAYAAYSLAEALGLHGEWMVMEGFVRNRFVMVGRETNEYLGRRWDATGHDLDFVFERDGCSYGVEVKNTLGYMDRGLLQTKVEICRHLKLRPVMVCRMLPWSWVHDDVIAADGFGLLMKWQLYHWTHAELAKRVRDELGLPVDAPRRLFDGTMDRFLKWHLQTCVKRPKNSHGGPRKPG